MSNSNLSACFSGNFVTFENTDLNIIDLNGSVWLTAGDLARALGYKSIKSISNLYNRNKDEFREDETALIDLNDTEDEAVTSSVTLGNLERKTRIYSARGCWTVAFLARTDRARAFRTWVKDVLENLPSQNALSQKTYLPNADHLSLRDTMMHPDAFEQIVNMAGKLVDSECISEDSRDSVKRARNMAAQRVADLQLDPMIGLRLLVESNYIGGFKTSVVPDNAHMVIDSELADYIRSASGPRLKFLPDIIHACTDRLDELYNLPLAQFKQFEDDL